MTYLLSAFKRLECPRCFAVWWGRSQQDIVSPPPLSMLTPYSSRHASTTIWRGECGGGVGRSWTDPPVQTCSDRFWLVSGPAASPLLNWSLAFARLSLFAEPPPPPTPTCCSSSLTKGFISRPTLTWAFSSWFSLHPKLLIGTLVMWILQP